MQTCTRCILPEVYRGIRFDESGVCNYCRFYEENRAALTDFDLGKKLLEERFDRVRDRGGYHCLVGLSGGKDSTYVLYRLVRHHRLNVLAFTWENGFLNDYARENIRTIVERLGVDHFFCEGEWEPHRALYRQAIRRMGFPCAACFSAGFGMTLKVAVERRIPLVLHGRSRSQMFKELAPGTRDPAVRLIPPSLAPFDAEANARAVRKFSRALRLLLLTVRNRELRRRAAREYFVEKGLLADPAAVPELVGYFLYRPYDERKMMDTLEAEIGWRRPERGDILTHHDCDAHDAADYLYRHACGYHNLCFELSVMIREGAISRDEAEARLAQEPDAEVVPEDSLRIVCERLGLDSAGLPGVMERARRSSERRGRVVRAINTVRRPRLRLHSNESEISPAKR